jgi:hypothetical protein
VDRTHAKAGLGDDAGRCHAGEWLGAEPCPGVSEGVTLTTAGALGSPGC